MKLLFVTTEIPQTTNYSNVYKFYIKNRGDTQIFTTVESLKNQLAFLIGENNKNAIQVC